MDNLSTVVSFMESIITKGVNSVKNKREDVKQEKDRLTP